MNISYHLIYESYTFQILPNSHQYLAHISSKSQPYFSHMSLGKSRKTRTPSPSPHSLHMKCWFFDFRCWSPLLNVLHFLGHFFYQFPKQNQGHYNNPFILDLFLFCFHDYYENDFKQNKTLKNNNSTFDIKLSSL